MDHDAEKSAFKMIVKMPKRKRLSDQIRKPPLNL